MALTFTTLDTDRQEADQTSYTTTDSISPAAGSLMLVAVQTGVATGTANQPTVTGGGVATWTAQHTRVRGTMRQTLFRGVAGEAPGSAQLVVDFAGQTQNYCIVMAEQVEGAVTTGTNGADAFLQQVDGQSASNAATFSLTLTNPLAHADNRAVGLYGMGSNRTLTATAPSELLAMVTGNAAVILLADAGQTPVAAFTGTNAAWSGLVVEIAASQVTPITFAYPRTRRLSLAGGLN